MTLMLFCLHIVADVSVIPDIYVTTVKGLKVGGSFLLLESLML